MNLLVRSSAAADLEEAFLWYESQRMGLGDEFLEAVTHVVSLAMRNPRSTLHEITPQGPCP